MSVLRVESPHDLEVGHRHEKVEQVREPKFTVLFIIQVMLYLAFDVSLLLFLFMVNKCTLNSGGM